jgi:uncharacterized alkaline shock family protein YloU
MEPQDTITIAPAVLITIAQHAAMQAKGVSHMGTIPVNMGRLFRGSPMGNGVVLSIQENHVSADVYLVVLPDVNIREVSNQVQQNITRAIEELVGMNVISVNIHVEDVNFGTLPATSA